ncbi:MAG: ADP-glyceromanno-heptose 6-epimerase [Armatimonadetes bacterium]|nr:ADP-glyceromanno-heptose 6-epimerase [Armatimonadota bacterium]
MIVVTGGAGFIGSNLIKGLNDIGLTNILVVDNLSNSTKHLNLNSLYIADFIDKNDFVENLDKFNNIKTIFHQGACTSTTETDGKYMMKNNYEYSRRLVNFSIKKGINFIYASSASVYGNGKNGFREDKNCEYPINIYAFSKYLFDNYVRKILIEKKNNYQITGLRYFNVYGYQENHKEKMASVAFHFYKQVSNSGKLKLFKGSENFYRDFVFIEDVIKVNLFFFEKKTNGIFNCGSGSERSFLDIANIFKTIKKGSEIVFIPFPENLKGKYQAFTKADLTNLIKVGYKKKFHSLEEGIAKYYKALCETDGYLV